MSRGFTLLELLLAASITTLVVVAAFVLYRSSSSMNERLRRQEARRVVAEELFRLLGRDLRQAWPAPSPVSGQETLPVFVGGAGSARWWTLDGRLAGSDLLEVEWTLDSEGQLLRRASPYRTAVATRNLEDRFEDEVVAEGIASLAWRYLTDRGWADRHEGVPPAEVEIEIAWEDAATTWKFAPLLRPPTAAAEE